MSKVSRHSQTERYGVTADWLKEFGDNLRKNSGELDYLTEYLNKQKVKNFATIEEKMADIKERIGFNVSNNTPNNIEKTSSDKCKCSTKKDSCSCSVKSASVHSQDDINKMKKILTYIKDMVKHEPHLDSATVISRCREEDDLHFNDLRIDVTKLSKYIDSLLDKKPENKEVKYVPYSDPDDLSSDQEADYYRHGEPSSVY